MGYWGETGGHCSLDSCWLAGAPSHRGLLYDFRDREDGEEGRKEGEPQAEVWPLDNFIHSLIHSFVQSLEKQISSNLHH